MPSTKAAQKQEILPDKDAGGPVSQLKRNLNVYAQTYEVCLAHAGKILVGAGLDGGEDEESRDRQMQIADTLFQQFWSDQIDLKNAKKNGATADVLKSFLEEQGGGRGQGMMGGMR